MKETKYLDKLVIIGNGFDVAHGAKTGYTDLMESIIKSAKDYYQKSQLEKKPLSELKDRKHISVPSNHIYKLGIDQNDLKFDDFIAFSEWKYAEEIELHPSKPNSIYFKRLFDDFSKKNNWADLESLYFELLQVYFNKKNRNGLPTFYSDEDYSNDIKMLNSEFQHLTEQLIKYLSQLESENDFQIKISIYNILKEDLKTFQSNDLSDIHFENLKFISFNYTNNTLEKISNQIKNYSRLNIEETIHLHGRLNDDNNPIIFGYGNENSDVFSRMLNTRNEDLLKNFKTRNYLRTNNYRNLLNKLDSCTKGIYLHILGHSCDDCDKSVMKMILTHPNIQQIELNYHKNEKKYFSKYTNVARIMNNPLLERQKLVPLIDTRMI